ncbi:MAG: hypothetical protein AB8B63_10940 [Granulosicoccus sp.]
MRLKSVFISAALLGLSQATLADQNIFLESDGLLLMEAESETAAGQWSLENEITGFSGNGYYLWQGPNRFGGPSNNADDHIEYRFRIQTAGNYQMRWRSRIGKGTQATEHNDSWISFPTGENIADEEPINGWTKVYMSQLDTWSWDSYTIDGKAALIRQYFEAGEHRILISGRSNGHAIDRISLYAYNSVNFSEARFNALPQSRASDAPGALHAQQPETCFAEALALRAAAFASDTGSSNSLSDELSVASNSRYGYLTFDLSRVSPTVADASLALILSKPVRDTTMSVYAGNHTDWNRTSDASQMPYPETLLGQASISGNIDDVHYINLDKSLLTRGLQTLILTADASADELNFATFDIGAAPQLQLTGNGALCEFFAGDSNTADESDTSSESDTDTDTDTDTETGADADAETDNDINLSGEAESSLIPIPTFDADNETINSDSTASTKSKGFFGGSPSLWMLLLVVVYSSVRQRAS